MYLNANELTAPEMSEEALVLTGTGKSSISLFHRSTTYKDLVFTNALQGRVSKMKQKQPHCNIIFQQIATAALIVFLCISVCKKLVQILDFL